MAGKEGGQALLPESPGEREGANGVQQCFLGREGTSERQRVAGKASVRTGHGA